MRDSYQRERERAANCEYKLTASLGSPAVPQHSSALSGFCAILVILVLVRLLSASSVDGLCIIQSPSRRAARK